MPIAGGKTSFLTCIQPQNARNGIQEQEYKYPKGHSSWQGGGKP